MPKKKNARDGDLFSNVQDYRHDTATRKNNPPAKIAAEGAVPLVPKAKYFYSPRRPPQLRFAPVDATSPSRILKTSGEDAASTVTLSATQTDQLPELLLEARQRPLTDDEIRLLADALRCHEPWLEWAEKREQHQRGFFEADPVALHIHERVSAQAILRVAARQDPQRDLFADPQLEYHQAVQFYRHDVDWSNRLILGDSLQVMSSLARREDLAGKVQMIYMDPPYGIKFASNFQPEVGRRDVKDKAQDLTREPEMVKAYRDTWHLGVHSYLSYLRDRLMVAKELLADSGSIFVQISDENLHRLRLVLDEIFGVENFVAQIGIQKTGSVVGSFVQSNADFLLWYVRDRVHAQKKFRQIYAKRTLGGIGGSGYSWIQEGSGSRRSLGEGDCIDNGSLKGDLRLWRSYPLTSEGFRETTTVSFQFQGEDFHPGINRHWGVITQQLERVGRAERVVKDSAQVSLVRFWDDSPVVPIGTHWGDIGGASDRVYVVQTNTRAIERCLLMTTEPGDLVLDPTCGSGTTAYVAEQWGRRWITVDTSRVAIAIARQRLLTAKYEMYRVDATSSSRFLKASGEDAASTSTSSISWFDPMQPIGFVAGGNLPHWRQEGAMCFVTFRTADSMPAERVQLWFDERKEWLLRHPEPHDGTTKAEYDRLFSARWENWLDECHGECLLKRPAVKAVVEQALRHFDGDRYLLGEFKVMPNHVHALVAPAAPHELSDIVQNWKSYTAHEINHTLGRKGTFWQKESFDHIVRGPEELERIERYIREQGVDATSPSRSLKTSGEDTASTVYSPSLGFVYKTVAHVTLKSIAQNTNLDPIFAKHEPMLEERLAACNKALEKTPKNVRAKLSGKLEAKRAREGKKSITDADERRWLLPPDNRRGKNYTTVEPAFRGWYSWEVPFDTDPDWPDALQSAVAAYRMAWRAKMDEVNACIAANAEQEQLVDQPETVRGVTRVSGPFTVEAVQPPEMSLGDVMAEIPGFDGEPEALEGTFGVNATSPSRELKISGEDAASTLPPRALRRVEARVDLEAQNLSAYLEKMARLLRGDGVRFPNNKQMKFSRLESLMGDSSGLHAEGRWTPGGEADPDPEGAATICVAFGPQYGPVTAKLVEDLVRASSRRGYTDLVIAGFSFDGPAQAVIEEAQHPKLRLHMAHIRPDVNPGMDGLLKEQPGSQLFTVFGQPRASVDGPDAEGMHTVTMEGVDIYNPVTNEIVSSGASKVAAWFLDSDYDGRTFCITQAFFPDKTAWEKLAKALKGVLAQEAFDAFSGTTSLPFAPGPNRCIAVKVIDPRGNEVMKVQRIA